MSNGIEIISTDVKDSYTKDPSTGELKILEENHYYPYGLKHQRYTADPKEIFAKQDQTGKSIGNPGTPESQSILSKSTNYDYKYNGFEYQDELGLNWYDYQARNYDPALGRWFSIDPLAEKSRKTSPYVYALNNPVFFIDPDGMEAEASSDSSSAEAGTGEGSDWVPNGDGTYTAEAGDSAATLAQDAGIDYDRANELVQSQIGENYTDTDGMVKSDVEVGDVVTVPEQVPIELETASIEAVVPSVEIAKNEQKIDSIEKVMSARNDVIEGYTETHADVASNSDAFSKSYAIGMSIEKGRLEQKNDESQKKLDSIKKVNEKMKGGDRYKARQEAKKIFRSIVKPERIKN